MAKSRKWLIVSIIVILVVYLLGVYAFDYYTYPATEVNGENRGLWKKDEFLVMRPLEEEIHFQGIFDEKLTIDKDDINLSYAIVEKVPFQQNAFLWPIEIFSKHTYKVEYKAVYDEKLLDEHIQKSGFLFEGDPTTDARLDISIEGAKIIPEYVGHNVKEKELKTTIIDAFSKSETFYKLDALYEYPKVTKEDPELVEKEQYYDQLLKNKVTLDFEDREFVLGGQELLDILDENGKVNDDKLLDWVGDIAAKTDTYGTYRSFTTSHGSQIEVPPGIYGWQMNVEETSERMKELLLTDEGDHKILPSYYIYGYERGENDIGSTYLEIDLSTQHIWAYIDGSLLLDSDIVTGSVAVDRATPVGVDAIWSKEKDQVLKGENASGSRYQAPVNYWMPINWGGVGLHDADWQSSFGGDIYYYGGSNGCINLPLDVARSIYDNMPVGVPVVIYESTTNYSPRESI